MILDEMSPIRTAIIAWFDKNYRTQEVVDEHTDETVSSSRFVELEDNVSWHVTVEDDKVMVETWSFTDEHWVLVIVIACSDPQLFDKLKGALPNEKVL